MSWATKESGYRVAIGLLASSPARRSYASLSTYAALRRTESQCCNFMGVSSALTKDDRVSAEEHLAVGVSTLVVSGPWSISSSHPTHPTPTASYPTSPSPSKSHSPMPHPHDSVIPSKLGRPSFADDKVMSVDLWLAKHSFAFRAIPRLLQV